MRSTIDFLSRWQKLVSRKRIVVGSKAKLRQKISYGGQTKTLRDWLIILNFEVCEVETDSDTLFIVDPDKISSFKK